MTHVLFSLDLEGITQICMCTESCDFDVVIPFIYKRQIHFSFPVIFNKRPHFYKLLFINSTNTETFCNNMSKKNVCYHILPHPLHLLL